MADRRGPRLAAVAGVALLAFGYPLMAVVDRDVLVAGVPLLWAYLFGAWALVVGLLAWAARER